MNAFFPLLAAVFQAGSLTLDKFVLSGHRVAHKTYIGVSFPLIFLIALVLFLLFRPPLNSELFSGYSGSLIVASAFLAVASNLIYYRALEGDQLSEIESLDILQTLPIIFISSIIFTDERKVVVVIPAIIASLAIIWSHWEHHHITIRRYTKLFFLRVLCVAPLSAVILKILLATWNPLSLELVRSGIVALLLSPLFFAHAHEVKDSAMRYIVLTNILTTIAWILLYFGYRELGVVHTVLILSIQPLLVWGASILFLREKFKLRKFIAFVVVLISIAVALVLGGA
ncbi:MAG: hypothetical protein A3G60_00915 [Candidatus Ryanbacteria bacterium RIFCSPLOWO2_12_FULL_47_9c]|uniref:EamA domain-containing protein n=2 Tax=Candidatus Ryaniibacteriota TaxID=1817914 RepID=A0A1G2H5C4_9BACT|nr:MAG: hypothetical protein A3J04_04390 [Candidatus Ryanbacteria bacterium RIFCSPLOWO2_02_FULL_47_14]OGZ57696.1 MAG: hypothetical protein A3G60_00915 [Candidatus Ryanbacteria bacterium RIFCSPLOWO2_12_FULL_47_9c]